MGYGKEKALFAKMEKARGRSDKECPLWKKLARWTTWLASLLLVFAAAWCITRALFVWLGTPPSILAFLITVLIAFLLAALIFSLTHFLLKRVGRKKHANRRQFGQNIVDALDRIGRGDFDVRIDTNEHEPLSELAESVNRMATELGTIEQQRQEFISNVSHEIQSPLTSIQGFASLMLSASLTEEERNHYLRIIETEAVRLSRLSENLLRLTALESDESQLHRTDFALDEQLRSAILMLEPQWGPKELEFDLVLDQVRCRGDESLLDQVWVNLIHNAIKFTPKNGTISLSLKKSSDKAQIIAVISDDGIGIDSCDLPHVFERFYRADKARDRSEGGNGLGLSLAKRIIELHEGTISVESELDAGTSFTISLPAYTTEQEGAKGA